MIALADVFNDPKATLVLVSKAPCNRRSSARIYEIAQN